MQQHDTAGIQTLDNVQLNNIDVAVGKVLLYGCVMENTYGTALEGDRAAFDAAGYPALHTNDTDTAATALHHTLGTGENQAAQGSVVNSHINNTSNPHSVTKSQVGLGSVLNTLHKFDATAAPTTGDDTGDGFSVGSIWINVTADDAYICLDATLGAAVWQLLDPAVNWSEITGVPEAFFPTPHADSHIEGAEYDEITSALNVLAYPMRASIYNDLPAAGRAGVFWLATDKGIIYRDNGSTWDVVAVTKFLDLAGLKANSNPGSPSANDLIYRYDKLAWALYDGTRWLSDAELSLSQVALSFTADGSARIGKIRADRTPYIVRVSLLTHVATTNDASNYWTITVRGRDAALSASSNVHQIDTSGDTAGTYTEADAAPSVTGSPTNDALLDIAVAKTGSPGTLTIDVTVYYRYVL